MNTTKFPIGELNRLRRRAQAVAPFTSAPDGWTISQVDPMHLLSAFETLRMKPGFALRAYLFRSGGDGNGIVWAMQIDDPLPSPDDCPRIEAFLSPPKPPTALDDVMQAIEGDRSPFSYLSASLIARELGEFGAGWHGVSWGAATIMDRPPPELRKQIFVETNEPDWTNEWRWCTPPPRYWRPQVTRTADGVAVSFCVLNIVGSREIIRITDTYNDLQYTFTTTEESIASGGGGIIW
jgi:hypothetical protein